jgi:uncharacterized membrane protein (UPF0127 family)
MPVKSFLLWTVLFFTLGCSSGPTAGVNEKVVILPEGRKIIAEVMVTPQDMARGMMYRDSLAPDRGMLFIHHQQGRYPYWMHNVKIPLDIIWMDSSRRVIEVSTNTPPCDGKPAQECPTYGGTQTALFVLELAGGLADQYGIKEGVVLDF